MDPVDIRSRIEAALPGSRVTIRDLTGGGDHFEAVVVSELFSGKSLIEQHRMVYAPLRDVLGGVLHALALRTSAS
jgi:stress-induced morphogen